ncbi:MAG TPA: hypothetical protein VMW21_01820 [Patescibacteria group bacterium]|nr:hypothetical protein [Patescibacteria group bacterium]
MSQKNGGNGNGNGNGETKITCSNRRCGRKFPVLVGKNDGTARMVICPHCKWRNTFSVDLNRKVHGPVAV